MSEDSLTILKYKLFDKYHFHVMDKFDYEDEPARLDAMIEYSRCLADINGDNYDQLWIKTCPIFPAS